jgi:hypothetical protein
LRYIPVKARNRDEAIEPVLVAFRIRGMVELGEVRKCREVDQPWQWELDQAGGGSASHREASDDGHDRRDVGHRDAGARANGEFLRRGRSRRASRSRLGNLNLVEDGGFLSGS